MNVGPIHPFTRRPLLPYFKCENSDKEGSSFDQVSVERAPYYSYMDSTSGQMEPASGARASIPSEEYWPEGTASQVRAARAPEPTGESTGSPSYGKNPGSRRKGYNRLVAASGTAETSTVPEELVEAGIPDDELEEPKEPSSEFVVYQTEPEDKKLGRPHPFIDPKVKKPIKEPLTSEELWWNWRKPEKEQWSRWQRRRPDSETNGWKLGREAFPAKLYRSILKRLVKMKTLNFLKCLHIKLIENTA